MYADAFSLVICCKMAWPWRAGPGVAEAGGILISAGGGAVLGARLLSMLPEKQETWDSGHKSPSLATSCQGCRSCD